MSGHSKWATTKHKKAAADAKRGKIFTKLIREITIASRIGGGDPDGNPRLRTAILKAKEQNMPADNIKKAIQRGTGELPGVNYEEAIYEGYGPGGVAMLVEITSDNKNRTVSEIRHIFSKNGGNMGEAGCVAWMFHKKGYITVEKAKADEEKLMTLALDAGAEDMRSDDEQNYEIITAPGDFEKVKKALADGKVEMPYAEVTMIPQNYIRLEGKDAEQMLRLMEALEEHDDVQNVYANFDIPSEIMEKATAS
ncbi:MAG TPA: YebC/PmpR family DNA-binding transcriptional regulator [Nitrospiria bacterium]|nr:YebC/PmpR family DNA-binding transcriptional regulator [Nitrospiria bacterium]